MTFLNKAELKCIVMCVENKYKEAAVVFPLLCQLSPLTCSRFLTEIFKACRTSAVTAPRASNSFRKVQTLKLKVRGGIIFVLEKLFYITSSHSQPVVLLMLRHALDYNNNTIIH